MAEDKSAVSKEEAILDSAVAEGGAYEVIRKRLSEQGKQLKTQAQQLNDQRLSEFGSSDMDVVSRINIRTENNCVARDIVQVGSYLLFGYNVFIGLKKETKVDDVFSLFSLVEKNKDSGQLDYELEPVNAKDAKKNFLLQSSFVNDFEELYRYYKQTKLVQLTVKNGKLLAGFQIGEREDDIRVFRWSISADGKDINYIDNRGERDIELPPAHDFEWQETSREDVVHGKHAHINIADKLFVETIGGDLTIKVENNTEDGLGIYREAVEDKTQSLDDAEVLYSELGDLVLLKIKPYRENSYRYFIFNTLNQSVVREDAIGASCVQLPEDHGIIYPGGYYLRAGDYKSFDEDVSGFKFKQAIKSPNGEDVMFVFYRPDDGNVGLFAYNMIEKSLQNPIIAHGFALSDSGVLVVFSAEGEPTRIHPMQIWHTPYVSDEFAANQPAPQSFLGKIGNAELVRGISNLYSICRMISQQSVSLRLYEELASGAEKLFDAHYWLDDQPLQSVADVLRQVTETASLVIDEFAKVQSIQAQSRKAMQETEHAQTELLTLLRADNWELAEEFVEGLTRIRSQRGHIITIKDYRYIDISRLDELEQDLQEKEAELSEATVDFLSNEDALNPYFEKVDHFNQQIDSVKTVAELSPVLENVEKTASGLDLLSELMATLKVADATVRTAIIDAISEVYAKLNQCKAQAGHKKKSLGSSEAVAQFSAQFKLFTQSITNALSLSDTPEDCDEQLSRLLVQLEELESQFSDYDEFLSDIFSKREEVYESFESRKQQLLDQRQRKSQAIADAASRIISSIEKRSLKFTEADKLNTYFASDALVLKIRDLIQELRDLDAQVKADDIESKYAAVKEQALRSLRDKTDIYEDGGNVIKLGPRHKFSVNTQPLDLTVIPRDGLQYIHISGTNFFEAIEHEKLNALKPFWDMALTSESQAVYRAEYLAYELIQSNKQELEALEHDDEKLLAYVREFAAPRYKEGYEKGIHDDDAAKLIQALLPVLRHADLLRYNPEARALAKIYWANIELLQKQFVKGGSKDPEFDLSVETWVERAQSAHRIFELFGSVLVKNELAKEIEHDIGHFISLHPLELSELAARQAAEYLVEELGRERLAFTVSHYGVELQDAFRRALNDESWLAFENALSKMMGWPAERWKLTTSWLKAFVDENESYDHLRRYIPEAAALINSDNRLELKFSEANTELSVSGLMGDHPTIEDRCLSFSLDAFLQKMSHHKEVVIPQYESYQQLRQQIIEEQREQLRLSEFKPRPLSSFVRNRLINESYLPIIGDNLAKQMGTIGEKKRSDLMGLLMMISPPGYGKTTLMEYVANRLGLIFMKINCPSLGHDVLSLDPAQAPNATAKQELIKLNLSLEMGNNVMLYLDDIQHTDPEFLQKFISLCDGTRRIEGVWRGKTKTYDMRGRKFCVVMAGNPYTESGEAFQVPDMLANRADIYNLGDILGGMDEQFALSYIENSLTSNQVLAPLAVREMNDVYKLVALAKGEQVATTDLSHPYSGAEINEITDVLNKAFVIQDVILKINQQYIASAAQDDKYRTEPSFKLQGSYRNMNKMIEKVTSVMNDDELMQLIEDHYLGEAQLLTNGAEANLLKLAELRGNMTDEQADRWREIKSDFLRNKAMGGDDSDTGAKVVAQLVDLVTGIEALQGAETQAAEGISNRNSLEEELLTKGQQQDKAELIDTSPVAIDKTSLRYLAKALSASKANVEVVNQPVPGIDRILSTLANTIENSFFPVLQSMDKKLEIDLKTHHKMKDISEQLHELEQWVKDNPSS